MEENVMKMKGKGNLIPFLLVVILVVVLVIPAIEALFTNRNSSDTLSVIEADTDYYLTWEEYVEAHGIEAWNWNDAADAIEEIRVLKNL